MNFKKILFFSCSLIFALQGMEEQESSQYDNLVIQLWGPRAAKARKYIVQAKRTQNSINYSIDDEGRTIILASFNGADTFEEVTVFLHRKKEFLTPEKYDQITRTYKFDEFERLLKRHQHTNYSQDKKGKALEQEFLIKQHKKAGPKRKPRCLLQ